MRILRRANCLWLTGAVLIAGCGVGPQAGALARREAAMLESLPSNDEEVRVALLRQAEAWRALSARLEGRQLGGMPVGADFRELVRETGLLARRMRELIEAGEDDAATNREALVRLRGLWRKSAEYLMP
jgi:hypothetical protein